MTKTIKLSLLALFATAAALAALLAVTSPDVSAHETGEQHGHDEAQATAEEEGYTYVAQAGDSYTQLARKAVQTYGLENSVDLSPAAIVYAETQITQEAGSPVLEVGQEIKLSKEAIKKHVEAAQKLSESERAAWAAYVPLVDFNTDNVGE